MKPIKFISEVRKYQMLTGTTDSELRNVVGWSYNTMRRRLSHPESITLGEAHAISSYLGIK